MKKVLLIVPLSTLVWGSKNTGGVDSVCQMIVKGLQENNTEAFYYRVVAFDPTNSVNNSGVVCKLNNHLEVVQYNVSDISTSKWLKLPGILHQRKYIIEQNKLFKPDIIHSHLTSWLLALRAKAPTLATLHNYKKICRTPQGLLNNFLYEIVVPLISRYYITSYTCVSNFLKQAIKHDISKPISIIYNPIDSNYFNCDKHKVQDVLTLVTCALLTPRKGIHHIIEVLAVLKVKGISATLKIIGPASDTDYLEELKELIREKSLENEVVFLGAKVTSEIVDIYASASVGLFLSEEETFGLVPLEMLAAQLPVIATNTGIITDFNQGDVSISGLTVLRQKDYQAIAETIINYHSNKVTVNSDYIKDNFSVTAIVESYENEYRKVLNNA